MLTVTHFWQPFQEFVFMRRALLAGPVQRLLHFRVARRGDRFADIAGAPGEVVIGEGFDGSEFEFNAIELVTDKPEYAPGENVNLLINTNRVGSTVSRLARALETASLAVPTAASESLRIRSNCFFS